MSELLAAHDERWRRLDIDGLAELWEGAGVPVYIGEEYPAPLIGRAALGRHWSRIGSRLRAADVRTELLVATEPVPAVAVVTARCEWAFITVEDPAPHRGSSWLTLVLARKDDRWRCLHYAESPASALPGHE